MEPLGNDRWNGRLHRRARPGRYEYTVEGWIDRFATWHHELSQEGRRRPGRRERAARGGRARAARPQRAGVGAIAADAAAGQARAMLGDGRAGRPRAASTRRSSPELTRRWRRHADRSGATRYDRVLEVMVERERARGSAPGTRCFRARQAPTRPRSATFDEAAARLPTSPSMGFDVLYLPPIHPIGRSFRKGPNNTLTPGPDDPGQSVGDRLRGRADTRRSIPSSARSRTSTASSTGAAASASRSRSTSPSSARPTIRTSASIPSGSGTGPTAPSSTPRTRRRSTRTSIRSTSSARDWKALWDELKRDLRVLDRPRRQDLPGRQPAHQAVPVLGVGDPRGQARSTPT